MLLAQSFSKVHRIVQEHAERGYQILIFGDPSHKEVRGILGWSEGRRRSRGEPPRG